MKNAALASLADRADVAVRIGWRMIRICMRPTFRIDLLFGWRPTKRHFVRAPTGTAREASMIAIPSRFMRAQNMRLFHSTRK